MTQNLLLHGKVVLTDARLRSHGLIRDGAVLVEGGRVAATARCRTVRSSFRMPSRQRTLALMV